MLGSSADQYFNRTNQQESRLNVALSNLCWKYRNNWKQFKVMYKFIKCFFTNSKFYILILCPEKMHWNGYLFSDYLPFANQLTFLPFLSRTVISPIQPLWENLTVLRYHLRHLEQYYILNCVTWFDTFCNKYNSTM